MINFASDNASGAHPKIIQAIADANIGTASPYGDDQWTAGAIKEFERIFCTNDISVHFVINGTGANVLAIKAATRSYHGVICTDISHINVDEIGAPENITGCKLLPVNSGNCGKLTPKDIEQFMHAKGVVHHNQPHVVSITQTTEIGTVYTPQEIRDIADKTHAHGMVLHMDGARISNAVAALDCDIAEITHKAGVDMLSFGGTKNGLIFAEAVVFFNQKIGEGFEFYRKQNLQLLSKMRFASCQFTALLQNDLWLKNARQANKMAKRLADNLQNIPHVQVTNQVDANAVFAILQPEHIAALQNDFYFYEWKENIHEIRLVCSFNTTEQEVDAFTSALAALG